MSQAKPRDDMSLHSCKNRQSVQRKVGRRPPVPAPAWTRHSTASPQPSGLRSNCPVGTVYHPTNGRKSPNAAVEPAAAICSSISWCPHAPWRGAHVRGRTGPFLTARPAKASPEHQSAQRKGRDHRPPRPSACQPADRCVWLRAVPASRKELQCRRRRWQCSPR